jgi:outer membrane protein OmpA-like peptidoglycan-associated protein
MNVNEQISKSVIDSDFKILFTCSGNDCGDVVGWSLLLSSLIMGDLQKQSFSVAKKDNNDGSSEYIAFYVTEIDHQPRALIDLVVAPVNHKFDLLVDSKQVSKNLMKDGRVVLSGLNFKLGSSQLPTDGDHVIKTMSQIILENPKKRFAIVGHTDSTGNYSHNIKLSKHRASAVRSELIIKYGVDSKQIIADGVGPLTPLTYNSDEVGRSANRRVELVQL